MEDSGVLTLLLTCGILILVLALCCEYWRCVRLETENRILRWFFNQQAQVDADYRKTCQAMHREAAQSEIHQTGTQTITRVKPVDLHRK